MVIIVSGGSKGIGLAIVSHLLESGHQVATFSRGPSPGLAALAATFGNEWLALGTVDIADRQALDGFVESVHGRWGRIEGLVNNAGLAVEGALALVKEDDLEAMIDVNLKGAIRLTRACVRKMLLGSYGRIVNISSIAGLDGQAGLGVYSATKAAVLGLTRSLARELGSRAIAVNAIAPGYVETDMSASLSQEQRGRIIRRTPLGRLAEAKDLFPVLDLLLREDLFMTGQTLVVDGGLTC